MRERGTSRAQGAHVRCPGVRKLLGSSDVFMAAHVKLRAVLLTCAHGSVHGKRAPSHRGTQLAVWHAALCLRAASPALALSVPVRLPSTLWHSMALSWEARGAVLAWLGGCEKQGCRGARSTRVNTYLCQHCGPVLVLSCTCCCTTGKKRSGEVPAVLRPWLWATSVCVGRVQGPRQSPH